MSVGELAQGIKEFLEMRNYVKIQSEFESFVKVTCDHMSCVNRREDSLYCNLKNIEIDSKGKCKNLDEVEMLKQKYEKE